MRQAFVLHIQSGPHSVWIHATSFRGINWFKVIKKYSEYVSQSQSVCTEQAHRNRINGEITYRLSTNTFFFFLHCSDFFRFSLLSKMTTRYHCTATYSYPDVHTLASRLILLLWTHWGSFTNLFRNATGECLRKPNGTKISGMSDFWKGWCTCVCACVQVWSGPILRQLSLHLVTPTKLYETEGKVWKWKWKTFHTI